MHFVFNIYYIVELSWAVNCFIGLCLILDYDFSLSKILGITLNSDKRLYSSSEVPRIIIYNPICCRVNGLDETNYVLATLKTLWYSLERIVKGSNQLFHIQYVNSTILNLLLPTPRTVCHNPNFLLWDITQKMAVKYVAVCRGVNQIRVRYPPLGDRLST